MKKILKYLVLFSILIFSLYVLIYVDLSEWLNSLSHYITFKRNIMFILNAFDKTAKIIILIIFVFMYIFLYKKQKWMFRVEKMSFGGMNIVFDRPDAFFKKQVKNFLNTKRTPFKFDPDRDNIYDTIGSFYKIYAFLRDEMKIFDVKLLDNNKCYQIANEMINELNEFLTTHQDNYRRWYEHKINDEIRDHYDIDISQMQKKYRHYDKLMADILKLNNSFNKFAKEFEIDNCKWRTSES